MHSSGRLVEALNDLSLREQQGIALEGLCCSSLVSMGCASSPDSPSCLNSLPYNSDARLTLSLVRVLPEYLFITDSHFVFSRETSPPSSLYDDSISLSIPHNLVASIEFGSPDTLRLLYVEDGKWTSNSFRLASGSPEPDLDFIRSLYLSVSLSPPPGSLVPREPSPPRFAERHMLLIINPVAGESNNFSRYSDELRGYLNSIPGFEHTPIVTSYSIHATQIARDLDLEEYTEVGIFGGDGTVNEVIQGLLTHSDTTRASQLPLAIFPGGRGNAVTTHHCIHSLEDTVLCVARQRTVSLDVASVFHQNTRRFAIVSLSLGVLADIDIGLSSSPCWKSLGSCGEAFGSIWMIVKRRMIRIRSKFVSGDGDCDDVVSISNGVDCPMIRKWFREELERVAPNFVDEIISDSDRELELELEAETKPYFMFSLCGLPKLSSDLWSNPSTSSNDGHWTALTLSDPSRGRLGAFSDFLTMTEVSPDGMAASSSFESKSFRAAFVEPLEGESLGIDGERMGYGASLIEIHRGVFDVMCL